MTGVYFNVGVEALIIQCLLYAYIIVIYQKYKI